MTPERKKGLEALKTRITLARDRQVMRGEDPAGDYVEQLNRALNVYGEGYIPGEGIVPLDGLLSTDDVAERAVLQDVKAMLKNGPCRHDRPVGRCGECSINLRAMRDEHRTYRSSLTALSAAETASRFKKGKG